MRPRSCPSCHGILVAGFTSCPDPWHQPLTPDPLYIQEEGAGLQPRDLTVHYHLAWYGHHECRDPDCALPRDDPANDLPCDHPGDCEGDCVAAMHNATRRAHLTDPALVRGIERVTGERYDPATGTWAADR